MKEKFSQTLKLPWHIFTTSFLYQTAEYQQQYHCGDGDGHFEVLYQSIPQLLCYLEFLLLYIVQLLTFFDSNNQRMKERKTIFGTDTRKTTQPQISLLRKSRKIECFANFFRSPVFSDMIDYNYHVVTCVPKIIITISSIWADFVTFLHHTRKKVA